MIEYKSGERLGYIKKSPHSPECVSSIGNKELICLIHIHNESSCIKLYRESNDFL